MTIVKRIKGERTRVMHDFAAQMQQRGYSVVSLRKRSLMFLRDRGLVQQYIGVYFLSHLHSQGKAYIGSPYGVIECPPINRAIMHALDMKRDTFGSLLSTSASLSIYRHPYAWLVAGHIQDVPPIVPAIEEIERYFESHLTIESILTELMTKPVYHYHTLHTAMQALAAAALLHREDLFDELVQRIKTSNIYYHSVALLVKNLRTHF